MRHPRWLLLPLVVCAAYLAVGCATPGSGGGPTSASPSATTSAPATAQTLKITRTGGIAGVNQSVEIALDGSWVYTDAKMGTTQRGTLTSAELAQLHQLLAAPAFLQQVLAPAASSACADAFSYLVDFGGQRLTVTDCGGTAKPAVDAALAFVTSVTPL